MTGFCHSMAQSPKDRIILSGKEIFIKRDDLLDFGITGFNGNKARKFLELLYCDFESIVSFGGNQSNAMQTLGALMYAHNKTLYYITPTPPKFLYDNPMGNYAFGLSHNVQYVFAPSGSRVEQLKTLAHKVYAQNNPHTCLFIPQGGSEALAQRGMYALVQELSKIYGDEILVFMSAGSGVSARSFLQAQKTYSHNMDFVALCCAGDISGVPRRLCADFAFGTLHKEIWAMYHNLIAQGIVFDLLYDCVGFVLLERALCRGYFSDEDLAKPWVFIHSGGLLGNASQILRYERKFGVSF
ncbi:MAG: 1-aminocyclopropane-1-carboxylate deaminase [Helicobacter sp.]|nr:1-aminocyclopropane-1-carboxylate deaminase [Helicobacter sp.]